MDDGPDDIVLSVEGALGTVTLNRPRAINALTLSMVRGIARALERWERDPAIRALLLTGAGPRGFCAGGDIVGFYHSALDDGADARRFWREEYALNARIADYPKPIVAVMDGIVMGGGVGLSGHARHRIATDRLVWAMPEVRIGFVPDVGGTYLLSRTPGELGVYLAATGERIGPGDAIDCGFADVYVHGDLLDALRARLRCGEVEAALAHAAETSGPAPAPRLPRAVIDRRFAHGSAREIVAGLHGEADPAAAAIAEAMRAGSPTAVEVAVAAVRHARRLPTLRECLAREYATSCACLSVPDFVEGIRAAVIDKDRAPRWRPATLEQVRDGELQALFGGLQ